MKWYQHLVDSEDDPDIMEAIERFGHHGYYVFWRTLSIIGREFDIETPGYICINYSVFLKKFQKVSQKNLKRILKYFQNKRRIFSKVFKKDGEEFIHINSPKFRNLLSDNAIRKIREYKKKTGSKTNPNRLKDKDKEKEKEKEEQKGKKEKKAPAKKKPAVAFDFTKWPNLNTKAWKEFEDHRAEIKKPLTDKARVLNLNWLLKYSNGNHIIQQKIIDNTIMSRWTKLCKLKRDDLLECESQPQKPHVDRILTQEEIAYAEKCNEGDRQRHQANSDAFEQEMAGKTPEERKAYICEMQQKKRRLHAKLKSQSLQAQS